MKINKERNEIILTYEELKKVFVNHDMEEWLDKPFINTGEVKEMFKYIKECINEAVFDYYDIREDLEDDYKNKCKYIVSLDTMELLVDGCSFVMNFEFEDLSDNIKELIKEEQVEYTIIKTEYKLK